MRRTLLIPLVVLFMIGLAFLLPACGGGGGGSSDSTATSETTSTDESESTETTDPTVSPIVYPVVADTQGFRNWFKFNKEPIQGATHGETNIYINQSEEDVVVSGKIVNPLPEGSLIVKEILSSGILALMKKVKNADPDHGDWLFIEYTASGSLIG